ncbi:hypothetical protein [Gymnodinialimonas hymeniacidonis]|uniref:hypothetical protein n=1 Tax=Gymnodinialimonas hymeniacidonis TaxID=3126508 RepID=UPI0034C65EE7
MKISLDHDAALVLFDFLSRTIDVENGKKLEPAVAHDGELWALNSLLAILETSVSDSFDDNYPVKVSAALQALVSKSGAWPSSDDES